MSIRIITDSTADLPAELAKRHDILIVPAYVRMGGQVFQDRIGLGDEDFYLRMQEDTDSPATEPPNPEDFADAYRRSAREADGIISIHISRKISATCNAAYEGKKLAEVECPVEIIDSESVSMGLGLLAVAAAQRVSAGGTFPEIVKEIRQALNCTRVLGFFDTVKYLSRGGRINRATAFFGSMLNIKPMLTIKNGEVEPAGQVYRRASGVTRLYEFAKSTPEIKDVAVVYSTIPEEARELGGRISAFVPGGRIHMARMGPVLGAHGGPGALLVALRTGVS